MQLIQLVYVSSYIDEYGIQLPEFLENSALCNNQLDVRGMTLFSNGNIIQLLEGRRTDVCGIFRRLPLDARQFQVMQLIQESIESHCLAETSIGFNSHSLHLIDKIPSRVVLFQLKIDEVNQRLRDSPGKVLMGRFALDHG